MTTWKKKKRTRWRGGNDMMELKWGDSLRLREEQTSAERQNIFGISNGHWFPIPGIQKPRNLGTNITKVLFE